MCEYIFADRTRNVVERPTWVGAFILATFSILAQYNLPLMSYGLILAVLYGVSIVVIRKRIILNKGILLFTIWCIVSQLIIYINTGTFDINRNTYFFMFVAMSIIATLGLIEENSFFKTYYLCGMICSILVIYQFIMANVYEIPQSAIKILPVAAEDAHFWIQNSSRVSGVFTEPQAYCSYIIPLLILLLFRRKFISAIFVSIAIFASTSSQGIILSVGVWLYYLIIHEKNMLKRFLRFNLGMLCGIPAITVVGIIPTFAPILHKIMSIDIFGYDIRLTKGFQIYFAMPIWDQITGIGFGNLRDYLLNANFDFFWIHLTRIELLGYITTMSNVLVSFGLPAFLLYLNIFIKNRVTIIPDAKLMLLIIFISSFTQTLLFNAWYIFYWCVYEIMDKVDNDRYYIFKFRSN